MSGFLHISQPTLSIRSVCQPTSFVSTIWPVSAPSQYKPGPTLAKAVKIGRTNLQPRISSIQQKQCIYNRIGCTGAWISFASVFHLYSADCTPAVTDIQNSQSHKINVDHCILLHNCHSFSNNSIIRTFVCEDLWKWSIMENISLIDLSIRMKHFLQKRLGDW